MEILKWVFLTFYNFFSFSLFTLLCRVNALEEQLHDQKTQSQATVQEESQKYRKELVREHLGIGITSCTLKNVFQKVHAYFYKNQ